MYCRECGEALINEKAVICVKCGISKGQGNNYCPECGQIVKSKDAEVCLNCGIRLRTERNNFADRIKGIANNSIDNKISSTNNNNKVVAGLLAIFLGGIGVHRFYLGYKQIGFIQLGIFAVAMLLFSPAIWACWIWAIIDAVQIFSGKLLNSDGSELL